MRVFLLISDTKYSKIFCYEHVVYILFSFLCGGYGHCIKAIVTNLNERLFFLFLWRTFSSNYDYQYFCSCHFGIFLTDNLVMDPAFSAIHFVVFRSSFRHNAKNGVVQSKVVYFKLYWIGIVCALFRHITKWSKVNDSVLKCTKMSLSAFIYSSKRFMKPFKVERQETIYGRNLSCESSLLLTHFRNVSISLKTSYIRHCSVSRVCIISYNFFDTTFCRFPSDFHSLLNTCVIRTFYARPTNKTRFLFIRRQTD